VRFLIDECLTVDLVAVAGESGHEAQHVAHVGRAGWKDWNVVRYASEGDFVLVTNNASDFRELYAAQPLHVNRVVQQRLFKAALDELAVIGEPVNRVLEVDLDGEGDPNALRLALCRHVAKQSTAKFLSRRLSLPLGSVN